jgi:small subunit ribosomal protein S6
MSEQRIQSYEALVLFPQSATANLTAAADHIRDILKRAGAELISLRKWDERRLAYTIKSNKRGVYFLVYFSAPTDKLSAIERSCNLSEEILRAMVTRADHLALDQMKAADGQQQLEDEAKLRASGAEPTTPAESEPGVRDDDDSEEDTSYADPPTTVSRP